MNLKTIVIFTIIFIYAIMLILLMIIIIYSLKLLELTSLQQSDMNKIFFLLNTYQI